jgi:O-antigen/teichoic acid export membrane protein
LKTSLKFMDGLLQAKLLTPLARGAGIAFVLQVSGVGLNYITQIFLARWMGPAEYGKYVYIIAWGTLLAIAAALGFPMTTLRFIPQYRTREQWARLSGVIRRSWQFTLGIGLTLSLLGTVILLVWSSAYDGSEYLVPLLLGIWLTPLFAMMNLQQNMLQAIRKIALAYAPLRVMRPLFVLVGMFFLLQMGRKLTSVLAIGLTILALLFLAALQMWLFWRGLPATVHHAKPIYETRIWLRVALPMLLISGSSILMNQTDILMIGAILGPSEVGAYNVAAKTAHFVTFILFAADTVAAPVIASLYARGDHEGLQRLASTVAHATFWPSLAVAILMMALANPILAVFGPDYTTMRWELIILILGKLVYAGTGSVGHLMDMTGHQSLYTRVFGLTTLINIALNAIGISLLGTIGAALATAVATALWNIWLHVLVVRKLGIYPSVISILALRIRGRAEAT